jgi:putative YphP/YqiW family bacilliredoxin
MRKANVGNEQFILRSVRHGPLIAVANSANRPDFLTMSFAGFDDEAVRKLREHHLPIRHLRPIALFKNGDLVHFVERHQIEGRPAQVIAQNLITAFQQYCN